MTDQNTGGAGGPQDTPRREQLPPPANERRTDERHVDERRTVSSGMNAASAIVAVAAIVCVAALIALFAMQPWNWSANAKEKDTPVADSMPKCTRDLTGNEVCCNRPGYFAKLETQNQSFRGQPGVHWKVDCHFNMARFKRDTNQ